MSTYLKNYVLDWSMLETSPSIFYYRTMIEPNALIVNGFYVGDRITMLQIINRTLRVT